MRNIQRITALGVIMAVLWFLYSSSDVDYGWAVWSILALVLVLEHLAYQAGIVLGIETYRNMNKQQQQDINNILDDSND